MSQFKTPLRYPGGKQRLSPFIKELLIENNIRGHYAEPYAGGSGVAIELLLTRKIDYIHLNDSDFGVYAFWHSVINKTDELLELISRASLTVEEWEKRKAIVSKCDKRSLLQLGFSVFYLNRVNRSGVLSAGLIGGKNQDGNFKMDARFAKSDLIRRIETIAIFKDKISVTNFDAEMYIDNYISNLSQDTLIYFDPPYYNKGSQLYLNAYKKEDHKRIARKIQTNVKHKWVLSYDSVQEILKLYNKRRHFLYNLQYSAARNYRGEEVFVFSDKLKLPQVCQLSSVNEGLQSLRN